MELKKIPPEVAPKPKIRDLIAENISDYKETDDHVTKGNKNKRVLVISGFDLELPITSLTSSFSSKSQSSGIYSSYEKASFLNEEFACDSSDMRGCGDTEKSFGMMFNKQRLQEEEIGEMDPDLYILGSPSMPRIEQFNQKIKMNILVQEESTFYFENNSISISIKVIPFNLYLYSQTFVLCVKIKFTKKTNWQTYSSN